MRWWHREFNITVIQKSTEMSTLDGDSQLQSLVHQDAYLVIMGVLWGFSVSASAFGIFTNGVNIITFVTMGIDDGVTTLFLGMSFSDLTFSLLTFICGIVIFFYILEEKQTMWLTIDPKAVAYFSENAGFIVQSMTALTSTFLAVARCMCVVRPLHFKNTFTRTRSLIGLACCFLFPMACQTVVFAEMGMTERFHESRNTSRLELWLSADWEKTKDSVRLILNTIIPFSTQIIVVVCVAVMIAKLREAADFRTRQAHDDFERGSRASKLAGKDRQVAVQVILICIIYMVTNIPKICHSTSSIVEPELDGGKSYVNLYYILASIRILFETINASVNLFLYYNFSTSFRSACFLTKAKAP